MAGSNITKHIFVSALKTLKKNLATDTSTSHRDNFLMLLVLITENKHLSRRFDLLSSHSHSTSQWSARKYLMICVYGNLNPLKMKLVFVFSRFWFVYIVQIT